MRKVAIIQARMGSMRLPNKVMKKILGKPVLWHIKSRLEKCELIDEVLIAATISPRDSIIEKFAQKNEMKIYRGAVDDIVDRFYKAATKFRADIVIRLWSDSPLIDPRIVDELVGKFLDQKAEYANNFYPRTFPFGMSLEVYSFMALEMIWRGTTSPFFRKYPFDYIHQHPTLFRQVFLECKTDLSSLQLMIDWPEDLVALRRIFRTLHKQNLAYSLDNVLSAIRQNPELRPPTRERDQKYHTDKEKWLQKRREDLDVSSLSSGR